MEEQGKNGAKDPKLPSWLEEKEDNMDDILLGAPKIKDDLFDAMLADIEVPPMFRDEEVKAAKVEATSSVAQELKPVEAKPEVKTEPKPEVKKEVEEPVSPELAKIRTELEQLEKIVDNLEFLAYLKPRLNRIRKSGCDPHDLVGLYRMASQVMLEQLLQQMQTMQKNKATYDKRLRQLQEEVLFEQSSALVTGKREKSSVRVERLAEPEPEPAPSSATSATKSESEVDESKAMAVLRKQMEIKDRLLLQAKKEAEAADKRCEKMAQDVANVRTRIEKDLSLKTQRAKEALFKRFLPVLDSFDGAISSEGATQDVASIFAGLKNIYKQLQDSCAAEGLEIIKTSKKKFDPNFHEAMGQVPTHDMPEDYIFDELRRGYLLDGKLLRATMVRLAISDGQPVENFQLEEEEKDS